MTRYVKGVAGPLDQGDILAPVELRTYLPWWPENSKHPLVIVTPTCDLQLEKADFHRLCVLQPFPVLFYDIANKKGLTEKHWDGSEAVSRTKWGEVRNQLRTAITNAWPRYHFMPKETGKFQTDYFIDFELLLTIPLSDLREDQRHVRLHAPYQQELIQRLTAHMMRIGTPDIPAMQIDATIAECVSKTKLKLPA
jgi:hypothetical protein